MVEQAHCHHDGCAHLSCRRVQYTYIRSKKSYNQLTPCLVRPGLAFTFEKCQVSFYSVLSSYHAPCSVYAFFFCRVFFAMPVGTYPYNRQLDVYLVCLQPSSTKPCTACEVPLSTGRLNCCSRLHSALLRSRRVHVGIHSHVLQL